MHMLFQELPIEESSPRTVGTVQLDQDEYNARTKKSVILYDEFEESGVPRVAEFDNLINIINIDGIFEINNEQLFKLTTSVTFSESDQLVDPTEFFSCTDELMQKVILERKILRRENFYASNLFLK